MAAGVVRRSALLACLFIASGVVAVSVTASGVTGSKYKGQSEVKRGQAFNITCTVSVNEAVVWTKDGKNLTAELGPKTFGEKDLNTTSESTITFESAQAAHAGDYQCSALHASEKHSVRIAPEPTLTGVYDTGDIRFLDTHRLTFNLTCKVDQPATTLFIVNWFKDNMAVGNTTLKDRYNLATTPTTSVLTIKPVKEDDYGNYTCRLQDSDASASFQVYGKPHVRLHPNQNVVEGQKIKITCTVTGKPYPTISWLYNNGTGSNETVAATERISFGKNEAGVENAQLVLADAVPNDYGIYYCEAKSIVGSLKHVTGTTLRVKDKYAALWPFIGICAEVVVLCAIILVYEKRRSKNTDMEDSDTDNHDQKQPIDAKETNVHQRK